MRTRTVSEETKRKISATLTGVKKSDETRKRMSESHTGKTLSEDHRRHISEALKKQWAAVPKREQEQEQI